MSKSIELPTPAELRAAAQYHLDQITPESKAWGAKLMALADQMDSLQDRPKGDYLVRWEIELDATSPEAAAEMTLDLMSDLSPYSKTFVVFGDGRKTTVNLGT